MMNIILAYKILELKISIAISQNAWEFPVVDILSSWFFRLSCLERNNPRWNKNDNKYPQ